MLGLFFLFNFFLHVICNSAMSMANSSEKHINNLYVLYGNNNGDKIMMIMIINSGCSLEPKPPTDADCLGNSTTLPTMIMTRLAVLSLLLFFICW